MGTRVRNWIARRRRSRLNPAFAVSSFTLFLLGFGFVYWLWHMFSMVPTVECQYAIVWLSGWFDFRAPFQWLGLAIVITALVWLLRVLALRGLNRGEAAFQLVFIIGLAAAFAAHKAYLFPYGTPSRAEVRYVRQIFMPDRLRLAEEPYKEIDYRKDWKYDYPPPPFATYPDRPSNDRSISLLMTDLFQDERSPLYSEYRAMYACYATYQAAVIQYEKDLQRWHEYWEGFDAWYALNHGCYDEKPPFWIAY